MAIKFGTPEWAQLLVQEVNGSSEYRNAAAGWGDGYNGNVMLVIEPDAKLANGLNLLIRLSRGTCHGAEFTGDAHHPEAGFALRAPFSLWKDILERKSMAATAILTGKMKVDGDKMTLLRHTAAHRAMVSCCSAIDTDFDL
ncbi:MAG TPA: SCP2 sterol-binding domain-containing protein [Candidatus Polarisedimenticolaceae bacterium]